MITGYSFRFALESLKKEFLINLMAVLSVGVGLFLVAMVILVFYNINSITKKLPEKLTIILYLKDNTTKEQRERLLMELKEKSLVKSVRLISKEQALDELKKKLKDFSSLMEGLDENPLPDSIEIRLKEEGFKEVAINSLLQEFRSRPEIEDIDYGKELMESLVVIKKLFESLGLVFLLIMLAGIIFNFYTTIKILFYRRKEEIETFKLLGASRGFIRAPFLIEGAVIGAAGGVMASLLIAGLYHVLGFLSGKIPFITSFDLNHQVPYFMVALIVSGGLLGILGGALSIGRIRY